jgi:hypothetical protein
MIVRATELAGRHRIIPVLAVVLAALFAAFGCGKRGVRVEHEPFDGVLERHVADGLVDYAALAQDEALAEYVAQVANADLSFYATREESMAFWINACNATVLHAVATRYPLRSVTRVPGFFDSIEHQVAREPMTLNAMSDLMWERFRDPRVRFVLSLAAVGGPKLQSHAFFAEGLDARLGEAVRRNIDEEGMVSLDREAGVLYLSAIFSWFEEEFSQDAGSVEAFIAPYLVPDDRRFLEEQEVTITYMLYDWELNAQAGEG